MKNINKISDEDLMRFSVIGGGTTLIGSLVYSPLTLLQGGSVHTVTQIGEGNSAATGPNSFSSSDGFSAFLMAFFGGFSFF